MSVSEIAAAAVMLLAAVVVAIAGLVLAAVAMTSVIEDLRAKRKRRLAASSPRPASELSRLAAGCAKPQSPGATQRGS